MTRYLLDTNILSEMMRNPQGRTARRIIGQPEADLCTSIVVAGELHFGAAKSGSHELQRRVDAVLDHIAVLPLAAEVGRHYGTVRARLERLGQPIGANDLWIAAHSLAAGCVLVTANVGEFTRVEGLAVENWLE